MGHDFIKNEKILDMNGYKSLSLRTLPNIELVGYLP